MKGKQIVRVSLEILQDSAFDLRSYFDPWLIYLEIALRSQSGRDRLAKSLPGAEKAEKGHGAKHHKTYIQTHPITFYMPDSTQYRPKTVMDEEWPQIAAYRRLGAL
jgi:hypothetical protein